MEEKDNFIEHTEDKKQSLHEKKESMFPLTQKGKTDCGLW